MKGADYMSNRERVIQLVDLMPEYQIDSFLQAFTEEIPNELTRAALDEYPEMCANPGKYKRYHSFREAMNEVLADA